MNRRYFKKMNTTEKPNKLCEQLLSYGLHLSDHKGNNDSIHYTMYILASVLASFPCYYKLLVKSVFSAFLRTKLLPLLSCFPNMFRNDWAVHLKFQLFSENENHFLLPL